MQKFDNFLNCFQVLKNSNRQMAMTDEIYRTGVIGQFSLTFEQMWKTLQEVMRAHAINEAENGSPREILKAGYKFSFLDNEEVWLQMLKDRNSAMHIYDEEAFVGVLNRVYDSYIDTFDRFAVKIRVKIQEIESEST
ncbi:MAG: HI0074 family nucleotidyltransferase substrate-binding subunit [Fibrobacter sp.]|nr:nucleotidyltransferase substrate binding protein [Fibrobacter sp.]MBO7106104.1 nucleotidyltransferase substrate binding protein [Fibrobacter sp.]MBR3670333.1 HI0074 family nucleotidyltransferase substrate-binding subunit [Fibrobacter sp.]